MIRLAHPNDVESIAAVHVSAWQAAYPGILPASALQAFTIDNRRKFWAGVRLDDPARPVFVSVEGSSVIGLAACGAPRDRDMPFDAELYVLNVDPGHWRRGVGRRLFAHCIDHVAARGKGNLYLWVVVTNERARRFYESLGGKPLADRIRDADFDGVSVPEIPYAWATLPAIAGRTG